MLLFREEPDCMDFYASLPSKLFNLDTCFGRADCMDFYVHGPWAERLEVQMPFRGEVY
jgi:hypothetical protein